MIVMAINVRDMFVRMRGGSVSDPFHPTDAELATQAETGTGHLRLDLSRRLVAEGLGTAFLIIAVIGSGIMASGLSPTDVGPQLLENAGATAGALIGLILMFGAVSGAHFNPIVTLVDRLLGTITTRDAGLYVIAQTIGGGIGAVIANLMFSLPAVEWSTHARSSGGLWLSEVVATIGLLLVIHAPQWSIPPCSRRSATSPTRHGAPDPSGSTGYGATAVSPSEHSSPASSLT